MRVDSELVIGGIVVPLHARMDWAQTYQPIGGVHFMRMQSGAAHKQRHWRKWGTTITASGTLPPGLYGLDYDSSMVMKCAGYRAISGTGLSYTLPSARRSDSGFEPVAYAMVGRMWVPTAVVLSVDEATVTPVSGAIQYRVMWWPEMTVYCEPPQEDHEINGAVFGWVLEAEEA